MSTRTAIAALLFGVSLLTLWPRMASAGSARDYLNAPVDTWLTFLNTGYFKSVTPGDALDVTSRVRSDVFSEAAVVTRTIDVWGRTGGVSVIVPYVGLKAISPGSHLSNDGLSDISFMLQTNLFGGPALTREQFRYFVPETFSSVHLIVTTPTGNYDKFNPVNPSSNRWTFFPTINYSYTPDQGSTWLEVYASTKVFTTNPDFGVGGVSRLDQDPLYLAEFHASRNLNPQLWVSADAYYNAGGETRIDGVRQRDRANTLRLGAGAGLTTWAGGDLVFNYEQVVAKPTRQPDERAFRLKLRQLW